MNRNLDGIYFRIKKGEKFENICFSDLTEEEKDEVLDGRSREWIIGLIDRIVVVYEEYTGIDISDFFDKLEEEGLDSLPVLKDLAKMFARNLKDLGDTFNIIAE